MTTPRFSGLAGFIGLVLIAFGLLIGIGGVWLLAIGGSGYYAVLAVGLLITGWMLLRRSRWALPVYAAILAATPVWSLWEVSLDWWPLAARLGVLTVIALVLITPWVTRTLERGSERSGSAASTRGVGHAGLAAVVVAVAIVSIVSWFNDPHDLQGALPPSQGALQALGDDAQGVPPGE